MNPPHENMAVNGRPFHFAARRTVIAALAPLFLISCAVSQPPMITSQTIFPSAISSIEMIPVGEEAGGTLRSDFELQLKNAFARQGVAIDEGSALVVDFSIASHPASTTVIPVGEKELEVPPQARRTRWYHKCAATSVKGSLAVFARDANRVVAKSSGEYVGCPGDREQLGNLAQLLVKAVQEDVQIEPAQP